MPPQADASVLDVEAAAAAAHPSIVASNAFTPSSVRQWQEEGGRSPSRRAKSRRRQEGELGESLLADDGTGDVLDEYEYYDDQELGPERSVRDFEDAKPDGAGDPPLKVPPPSLKKSTAWFPTRISAEEKRQHTQYAIFFYYFFHGVSFELPVTALYLVLKEHFHLLPYQYSYIKSLDWIPWALKPLFGYISDNYPIFGLRRCPYLALGVVVGVAGWLLLASPWIEARWMYLTVMIVNSFAMVLTETAVDSLIAEIARTESEDNVGYLQSCAWTFNAAGSILGALTPIVAFSFGLHPKYVLLVNGLVMGASGLSLPWMHEMEVVETAEQENVMAALRNPLLLKALMFVFIVASSPTSGDAYQYFQSDVLKFSPAYISWTVVIMTTANFGAAYAYAAFLRKRNMRSIFRNVILFIIFVGLFNITVVQRWNVNVGIPDKVFILGDFVAQGVAGQLIFMPVAVLAARMSPAGGEGFVYATAMSVLNISLAFQEFFSGLLAKLFGIESGHYENLTKLMLTVSALTLIPLAFLHLVPELSKLGGDEDDNDDFENGVDDHGAKDALFKDDRPTGVPNTKVAAPDVPPGPVALMNTVIRPGDSPCGPIPEYDYELAPTLRCCAAMPVTDDHRPRSDEEECDAEDAASMADVEGGADLAAPRELV